MRRLMVTCSPGPPTRARLQALPTSLGGRRTPAASPRCSYGATTLVASGSLGPDIYQRHDSMYLAIREGLRRRAVGARRTRAAERVGGPAELSRLAGGNVRVDLGHGLRADGTYIRIVDSDSRSPTPQGTRIPRAGTSTLAGHARWPGEALRRALPNPPRGGYRCRRRSTGSSETPRRRLAGWACRAVLTPLSGRARTRSAPAATFRSSGRRVAAR